MLKPLGKLITVASPVPEEMKREYGDRVVFFLVEVTAARLDLLSEMFDKGQLRAEVGTVLPLEDARKAHGMLAGAPHQRGKSCWRSHPKLATLC